MSTISLRNDDFHDATAKVLVFGVGNDFTGNPFQSEVTLLGLASRVGSTVIFPAPESVQADRVVAVRLGDDPTVQQLRLAAATAIRAAGHAESIVLELFPKTAAELQAITEGIELGGYNFTRYKSTAIGLAEQSVTILCRKGAIDNCEAFIAQGQLISSAVNMARDWVNIPPRDLTPKIFAEQITALATPNLTITTWGEEQLGQERCQGLLAVGSGSVNESQLVTMTYAPPNATKHLVLVGKGITFDSGGLSIKSDVGMQAMKFDMAGAAAIAAAVWAIAALELPVKVTGIAALAENMPGGGAMHPGDVLTFRNGKTVEVLDTDEEGRLVLADGLVLAAESQPDLIVDLATLTGACAVALGVGTSGIFANSDELHSLIHGISKDVDESMWPLPLSEAMTGVVRSSRIADLRQHNPRPYGGTLFAAAFLSEFVEEVPWVHLDIAPAAYNDGDAVGLLAHGGTGVGVRTIVELARQMSQQ